MEEDGLYQVSGMRGSLTGTISVTKLYVSHALPMSS